MNNLLLLKYLIVFTITISLSGKAWADWKVTTKDDAFGGDSIIQLLGTLEGESGLMYECRGNDLLLNYLEKDDFSEIIVKGTVIGDLAVRVDNEKPIIFSGTKYYRHSHNYISLRTIDKDKIIESLNLLKNAKVKVVVGVRSTQGVNVSRAGNFHNAPGAVRKFARECGLDLKQKSS